MQDVLWKYCKAITVKCAYAASRAAWFFKLKDLGPFIVDIDTEGNNFFDKLDGEIAKRKARALNDLGIDPSFEFTKLY